ncbi:Methyltransferase domain-containing protein [Streptoalloteichus tenebrarius]|uniref:Methyltransferase domain-containing protein n=1 Tax=Streptoalloteichus tenebrarius (strain ATCC 17920 / DSM 40477 / JCM 4838 / CBS 697.72 / NBRC 16177 / NCIMB 11028 / NRRL B-12390 / A12253. 1 / ISP 5477) TaxID=1933 RepID=A0ABT1HLU5_STRSD|nr:class I SAM-dependent methyltransferase [Streptoalloteichus tenebrarius]MCP2256464.1 Methyltransferase domain-containing protein [Streptoalloteichus tenebrarius]BFF04815.1 class I SAM-dependent methyltransferase [Streptoalloteichus tenebrarius]
MADLSLETTRTFYDTIADDYAKLFKDPFEGRTLDRALLTAFAELVRGADAKLVADVGCGPGRVTAFLHGLGLDVLGVDLSSGMLAVARRENPELRFEQGTMTDLDLADGALGGLVAWYSVIHTPQERLPLVFAEFHRVLAPGGHLMVAFQVGDEPLHLARPFGHPVSLDFNRLSPDDIADLLGQAGFTVNARTVREPIETESTRQAFLLASKPARP